MLTASLTVTGIAPLNPWDLVYVGPIRFQFVPSYKLYWLVVVLNQVLPGFAFVGSKLATIIPETGTYP